MIPTLHPNADLALFDWLRASFKTSINPLNQNLGTILFATVSKILHTSDNFEIKMTELEL